MIDVGTACADHLGERFLIDLGHDRVQPIGGRKAGFRVPTKWNVSSILGGTKGLAIRTKAGWELADAGKQHLKGLGVAKISPAAVQVATDLRELLAKVNDEDTRSFVEEAVRVDAKWKAAKTTDDIGRMKENDFLDRLAAISVIGKNVKEKLQECLKTSGAQPDLSRKQTRPAPASPTRMT